MFICKLPENGRVYQLFLSTKIYRYNTISHYIITIGTQPYMEHEEANNMVVFIAMLMCAIFIMDLETSNSKLHTEEKGMLNSKTFWFFLNALPSLEFGKSSYVMVRRLPHCFVCECLAYFRCLWVVYQFANVFLHQQVEDFIHKNSEI